MDNIKRSAAFIAVIVFGVLILCMLLSFAINGMSITPRILSDYIFMCSMPIVFAGGVGIVLPFSIFKAKLRKNPTAEKVETGIKKTNLWKLIFISGIVLISISYFMVSI